VADLESALQWYDAKSPEAGNRFRIAVNAALDKIEASPELRPIFFPDLNVRVFRLPRFPYLEGVFHAASHPSKWRRRAGGST
jgi:hypothetical protein